MIEAGFDELRRGRSTRRCVLLEYTVVDGEQVAFERRGRGEPLVLLHGLPGDRRIWRRQLAGLADEFMVVAWDAPGSGRSWDPPGSFGVTEVAGCLLGFIEALDLGRPHVVGLSWGSGVALALCRLAPGVPSSIVLSSGYAGWAGSLPADVVVQRLDAYLTASRTPRHEALSGWATGLFGPSAPVAVVQEGLSICSDFHPDVLATLARLVCRDRPAGGAAHHRHPDARAAGRRRREVAARGRTLAPRRDPRLPTRRPTRGGARELHGSAGRVQRRGPTVPAFGSPLSPAARRRRRDASDAIRRWRAPRDRRPRRRRLERGGESEQARASSPSRATNCTPTGRPFRRCRRGRSSPGARWC